MAANGLVEAERFEGGEETGVGVGHGRYATFLFQLRHDLRGLPLRAGQV